MSDQIKNEITKRMAEGRNYFEMFKTQYWNNLTPNGKICVGLIVGFIPTYFWLRGRRKSSKTKFVQN